MRDSTPTSRLVEGSWASACACVVLLGVFATVPIAESGFNDDWSYTHSALRLAETGRLTYNGWATTMIGAQAYWAALWIRLLGFSHLVTRLSVLPFACGCAILLFRMHRAVGLGRGSAFLAVAAICTSPILVPSAASFMTDLPGFFFFLLTASCFARSIERPTEPRASWAVAAFASSLLAGSIRQVFWASPFVAVAYLVLRSPPRRFRLLLAGLMVVYVLSVLLLARWFNAQPYAIQDKPAAIVLNALGKPWPLALVALSAVFSVALYSMPFLLLRLDLLRHWFHLPGIQRAAAPLLGCAVGVLLVTKTGVLGYANGNMVTQAGLLGTGTIIGHRPALYGSLARVLLLAVASGLALAFAHAGIHRWLGRSPRPRPLHPLTVLYLLLLIPYGCAVVARGVPPAGGMFDRYFMVLLPGLSLLTSPERALRLPVAIATCALLAYAAFGVAATHDYFAFLRARELAAARLAAESIPRTRISGGFEFDAWTQTELTDHINDPRLADRPGVHVKHPMPAFPAGSGYGRFLKNTPDIRPEFVLTISPFPRLEPPRHPVVEYTTWLPPGTGRVYTQRIPSD